MIYQWATHSFFGLQAEQVGRQLDRIRLREKLTTEAIVEDSKRPDTALNGYFEWNNTIAGHQWRLEQARSILRALVIVDDSRNEPVPMRAFVSVIESESESESESTGLYTHGRYEAIHVALATPVLRDQILERAWRELQSWRRRYDEYKEFVRVHQAIDEELSTKGAA